MPRSRQPPERDTCSVLACSAGQVSGSRDFRDPESGRRGRRWLGHPSKAGCTSPGRGVGRGGSRQEGLKLLGPLTLEEWGCGEGAALAGDISPGRAFEKFQMEEVSEQPAVQAPTPDPHTWVSTSQDICLVRPPVLEACTPERGWGPGAGLALCCPHLRALWCLCSPGRR